MLPTGLVFGADLDDYVKAPDSAFAWKEIATIDSTLGKVHRIDLTSQVWQGITWKHELVIYEPTQLTYRDAALLFITGGSTGGTSDEKDHSMAFSLTRATGARVAVLHQVPNQPLLGDRKEDDLISETFVRYLETKDSKWPLLFPMAKSAVRAMDAVQAWAKEQGKDEIGRFVVTGASKRGWTTWLTGAVDNRVIAIAPMVIVMLNMGLQGPNQLDVWGQYSEQIDDYVRRGLMERAKTPEGAVLWKMVDPYTYRDRLSIPKMLINGSNDRYWTLNAIDLYWNGLKGPKHLVELPNAGHGLDQNRNWAINGLGAFFRHQVSGRAMPEVSWTAKTTPNARTELTVRAEPAPRSARLWTTKAANRDFRESRWEAAPLEPGTTITASVTRPADGQGAGLVDLEYEIDGISYHLTTTFVEAGVKPREPVPARP